MPAVNLLPTKRNFLFIQLKIKQEQHIFLIDTGAEGTLLAPELIDDIKPHRLGSHCGVGGTEQTHTCLVRFRLLEKTIREVTPGNFLDTFSRDMGFKVSGILGQDLFSQFSSYIIDNKKGQFIFTL
jgi:hypothetical protein